MFQQWVNRLRRPFAAAGLDDREVLYAISNLGFLGFLFLSTWLGGTPAAHLATTLATIPLFLFAYLTAILRPRWRGGALLLILALALALMPVNWGANTYLVYFSALAAVYWPALRATMAIVAALLIFAWIGTQLLSFPPFYMAITTLLCISVALGNAVTRQLQRKDAALRLSQAEVRTLAQVAERERIGRDLHDLLGHSLSLIVLKAELAHKLSRQGHARATQEMAELEQVARQTLAQVRRAVSGIRAAGLDAELAGSKYALQAAGTALRVENQLPALPATIETALALVLREACTNVIRHARAENTEIRAGIRDGQLYFVVADDGVGGIVREGTGLASMRERAAELGGSCTVQSGIGGTEIRVQLPWTPSALPNPGQVMPA